MSIILGMHVFICANNYISTRIALIEQPPCEIPSPPLCSKQRAQSAGREGLCELGTEGWGICK